MQLEAIAALETEAADWTEILKSERQSRTAGGAPLFLMNKTNSLTAICPFFLDQLQGSSCWPEHLGGNWGKVRKNLGYLQSKWVT